ncbi:MAG: S-methyl-5-thioribose-1-phosphate isomerase [Chloroflexi bacterium]|nr:S-methyl-5-thioribose-1-phosphate isomerase [Chloroflexota bacterium]
MVPLEWTGDTLRILDQTKLPQEQAVVVARTFSDVAEAIQTMQVRGAPAIGVAAAYAMVLAVKAVDTLNTERLISYLSEVEKEMANTRPTAVNLRWALNRMMSVAQQGRSPGQLREILEEEAVAIHRENVAANRRIGELGAELIPKEGAVLTHCNTGALATAGYGTAIGVIRAAWEQGSRFHVLVTETRPLLQGARLTAWELVQLGIPTDLIVDSAAGSILASGEVKCVIVGADRIAANGDVANKIGTYPLAVLAHEFDIPFYVAAPTSSVDLSLASGDQIPLEERDPEEVTLWNGRSTAPKGITVRNLAFDVTPNRYITAIITERGIARPPLDQALGNLVETQVAAAAPVPETSQSDNGAAGG